MLRKLVLLTVCALMFTGILFAQQWWEKKPYTEWNKREATRMLDSSPWGKVFRIAGFEGQPSADLVQVPFPVFLHAHFLSAKPIRMAIARVLALDKAPGVNLNLDQFVAQPATERICLAVTVSGPSESQESVRVYHGALMNLRIQEVTNVTFLSTNLGKRVHAVHYEPPGEDGLGAKYYFPRTLPDGSHLLTAQDKEIRFETTLTVTSPHVPEDFMVTSKTMISQTTERVLLTFDLRKMLFEGKPEI